MSPLLLTWLSVSGAATISVGPSGDHADVQDAIDAASSGDLIYISTGTYTGPYNTSGKDLTIRGSGTAATVLTAGSSSTVLTVDSGETIALENLAVSNALQGIEVSGAILEGDNLLISGHSGRSPGSGVGVYAGGYFSLTGSTVQDNAATPPYDGGGIYAEDSELVLDQVVFQQNSADEGGGVFLETGTATLTDCTFDRNRTDSHGGGLRARYSATVTGTRLTFTDNIAGGRGGALATYTTDLVLTGLTATGNQTTSTGGALHIDQSSATVTIDGTITGNTAGTTGGGIVADDLTLNFSGTLAFNVAGSSNEGGGIYANNAQLVLSDIELSNNTAETGGGIYAFNGATVSLTDATVDNNAATSNGGAIWSTGAVTAVRTTGTANTSGASGGFVYADGADVDLEDVTLASHAASTSGGTLRIQQGDLRLAGASSITSSRAAYGGGISVSGNLVESVVFEDGPTLSDHIASVEGGCLYLVDLGEVTIDGTTLTRCTAATSGGGAKLASVTTLSAVGVTVTGNQADRGAGLHLEQIGTGALTHSYFGGNQATVYGGGLLSEAPTGIQSLHQLVFVENAAPDGASIHIRRDNEGLHDLRHSDLVASDGDALTFELTPDGYAEAVSIAHSTGAAVSADSATPRLAYCAVWDNAGGHWGGAMPDLTGTDGNLEGDPDYAAVTQNGDWTDDTILPGSLSALRDAADPATFDLDGSRADIGHLGGPFALDQDSDGDGVFISDGDCDDAEPTTYPGATETWYDGEDSDCAGDDDFDADADGSQHPDDCDDTDPTVFPGANDDTADGTDQDCDGTDGPPDEEDPTDTGEPNQDDPEDSDGDGSPSDEDCNDADPAVSPSAAEVCGNGIDDDCDSYIDDFDSDCTAKAGDSTCATAGSTAPLLAVFMGLLGVTRRRRQPNAAG